MKHLALQISTVIAVLLSGTAAYAQQKTLYERLGGVFAIAAVVNHFSDAVVKNPIVGQRSKNPAHQKSGQTSGAQIHAHAVGLPGRRRALPVQRDAPRQHRPGALRGPSGAPDLPGRVRRGRRELGRTLDVFKVPDTEKEEVLAAFAAHKGEVPEGHSE